MDVTSAFYGRLQDIWVWVWFSCGGAHRGMILITIFRGFFASANEILILAGGWALGYHSKGI